MLHTGVYHIIFFDFNNEKVTHSTAQRQKLVILGQWVTLNLYSSTHLTGQLLDTSTSSGTTEIKQQFFRLILRALSLKQT